jgi:hypothetical protein
MHTVVNRIPLREPLSEAELAAAQRDLNALAPSVEGLEAIHLLRTDGGDLIVLVFGADADALERTREELGNAWMRQYVIPHAAGPPERTVAELLLGWQRARG